MESRKLEAVEAAALLRSVLAQIDVAIFTFDRHARLRSAMQVDSAARVDLHAIVAALEAEG